MAKRKQTKTKKSPTNDQIRQREINDLRLRLADLARGAAGRAHVGGENDEMEGGLAYYMGIAEWIRFISAAKDVFAASSGSEPEEGMAVPVAFKLWNLPEFSETLDRAAEHLHSHGARAR